MGELTAADVALFTGNRLEDDNGLREVTAMLNAAVSTVRRDAGWHVCPVHTNEEFTLDGPDSRILPLPTRKLGQLIDIEEDGNPVDLSTVRVSTGTLLNDRPVAVRKKSGGWWSGDYGSIVVHMTHGFTEAEASDWRRAILTMVDQMSLIPVGGSSGFSSAALKSKRIDDVAYGFDNTYVMMAEEAMTSVYHILCDYRLPRVEFI